MFDLKKNHELFWLLEVLLLTPVAFFWSGVLSYLVSGSGNLLVSVVGLPLDPLKSTFITLVCPAAAAWIAYDYLSKNKKEKSQTKKFAKAIIAVSVTTIVLIIFYLYQNRTP